MKNKFLPLLLFTILISLFSCNNLNEKELKLVEGSLIGKWYGEGDEKFILGGYISENYTMFIKKEDGLLTYDWKRKRENNGEITNFVNKGTIELKKGKDWNGKPSVNIIFIDSDGDDFGSWDWSDSSYDSLFYNLQKVVSKENEMKKYELNSKIRWKNFYFVKLYRTQYGKNTVSRFKERFSNINNEFIKLNPTRKNDLYKLKERSNKPSGLEIFSKWDGLNLDMLNVKLKQLLKVHWKIQETNNLEWRETVGKEVSFDFVLKWLKENKKKFVEFSEIMKNGAKEYVRGNSIERVYSPISIPIPQNNFLNKILNYKRNNKPNTSEEYFFKINQIQRWNNFGLPSDVLCNLQLSNGIEPLNFYRIKLNEDFTEDLKKLVLNSVVLADSWSYLILSQVNDGEI